MSTWVQVQRAAELSPGLTIEIRPCGFCGRTERLVLLRPVVTASPIGITGDGDVVPSSGAWATAPGLCHNPRQPLDPSAAIATGRLWRLGDEALTVGETTTRTLERVK